MAIIQPQQTNQMQKARALAVQLRTKINSMLAQMTQTQKECWSNVWENADVTPEQLFQVLGTDGGDLMRIGVVFSTAIESAAPGTLPTKCLSAGKPYTTDANGIVTITPITN